MSSASTIFLIIVGFFAQHAYGQMDSGWNTVPLDCRVCFYQYFDTRYERGTENGQLLSQPLSNIPSVSIEECSYTCLASGDECAGAEYIVMDAVSGIARGNCTLYRNVKDQIRYLEKTAPSPRYVLLDRKPEGCMKSSYPQAKEDEDPLEHLQVECCKAYATQKKFCNRLALMKENPDLYKKPTTIEVIVSH